MLSSWIGQSFIEVGGLRLAVWPAEQEHGNSEPSAMGKACVLPLECCGDNCCCPWAEDEAVSFLWGLWTLGLFVWGL